MGLFDRFKRKQTQVTENNSEGTENDGVLEENSEVSDENQEVSIENPELTNENQDIKESEGNVSEASQQSEKEEVVKPEQDKAEVSTEDASDNQDSSEDRRFTMMIEKAYQLDNEQGVMVLGNLHGKMLITDTIYLLFPNGAGLSTKVESMEVGPGRMTEVAENEKVALHIKAIKEKRKLPQYTIITNIKPNKEAKDGREIENSQLLGLSMEYPSLGQEPTYNNLLIYVICHSKFVVPAALVPAPSGQGNAPQIKFPSLLDPNDHNRHVLPVFTDWDSLTRWKDIFDEKHPAQCVVMSFPEAVSVCKGNGIVVNPYGPMTIVVTKENMQQIVNMESYKKEFGSGNVAVPEEVKKTEQEPRMLVGVPKDNPEVRAVTTAIVEYVQKDNAVKRVDLLFKMDLKGEPAFICVADCPQEQASRVFTAINKAASPKLKEVKRIDFLLYGASKLATDLVTDKSIIYQANV